MPKVKTHSGAAQMASTLGGLLGEDVALVSVCSLNLTGGGQVESLLSTAVGLYLGHKWFSFRFFGIITCLFWGSGTWP